MNGASKGSSFEREICKRLSRWWSAGLGGLERDDIFWRSSQSGGRATQRAKQGKKTFGSYGDIAAVDPIGAPLLQMFTIELKRGRSHGCPGDLLESASTKKVRPFEKALQQAMEAAGNAGSLGWMLISKRDRKVPMIYLDLEAMRHVNSELESSCPRVRYSLPVNVGGGTSVRVYFVGMPLEDFLVPTIPEVIVEWAKRG